MGKVKKHGGGKSVKKKGGGDRGGHVAKKKHTWKSVREKNRANPPEKQSPRKQNPRNLKLPTPEGASLRSRALERLSIARFRSLNADIDSRTPTNSKSNPLSEKETFKSYHTGFNTASSLWKQNPVDLIADWICKSIPKSSVVADFGCGNGKLAKMIPNKTHSFDLHALEDHVTEADMSDVPLGDGSVHVVVFCLSLMGSDVTRFIMEGRRVLVDGGRVKIAEAAARLSGNNMRKFISGMSDLGFQKISVQEIGGGNGNTHVFVIMEFRKVAGRVVRKRASVSLGACVYKKR